MTVGVDGRRPDRRDVRRRFGVGFKPGGSARELVEDIRHAGAIPRLAQYALQNRIHIADALFCFTRASSATAAALRSILTWKAAFLASNQACTSSWLPSPVYPFLRIPATRRRCLRFALRRFRSSSSSGLSSASFR